MTRTKNTEFHRFCFFDNPIFFNVQNNCNIFSSGGKMPMCERLVTIFNLDILLNVPIITTHHKLIFGFKLKAIATIMQKSHLLPMGLVAHKEAVIRRVASQIVNVQVDGKLFTKTNLVYIFARLHRAECICFLLFGSIINNSCYMPDCTVSTSLTLLIQFVSLLATELMQCLQLHS